MAHGGVPGRPHAGHLRPACRGPGRGHAGSPHWLERGLGHRGTAACGAERRRCGDKQDQRPRERQGELMDFDELVAALRAWAANGTNGERAALELLAWHGGWLRRGDFLRECIDYPEDVARISWTAARSFADRVTAGGLDAPRASTSEAAILDLAVALGKDQSRLSTRGHAHRRAVVNAFTAAAGLGELVPPATTEEG